MIKQNARFAMFNNEYHLYNGLFELRIHQVINRGCSKHYVNFYTLEE